MKSALRLTCTLVKTAPFSTLTRFVTSLWFNRSCMAPAAGRAPGPQAGLHQPPLALPAPIIALDQVGGKDKNNGSRPISRVLCLPPGGPAGNGSHSSGRAVARAL